MKPHFLLLFLAVMTNVALAQPVIQPAAISVDDAAILLDADQVTNDYTLKTVVVDASTGRVLVQYDVLSSNGTSQKYQVAQFSLNGDRFVNYKMAMLMLLREALKNPNLPIFLGLAANTPANSFPTLLSVAATPVP